MPIKVKQEISRPRGFHQVQWGTFPPLASTAFVPKWNAYDKHLTHEGLLLLLLFQLYKILSKADVQAPQALQAGSGN